MRAKFEVRNITRPYEGAETETLELSAVCGSKPFGPNGESDDNTYARYTPCGNLSITVNNPNLVGKFAVGEKYYLDFTKATE